MADWHAPQGPFDIPDVPNFIPRRMKPWIFIFFVLIIAFDGVIVLIEIVDSHFTIRKQPGSIREIIKFLSVMPEIL